MRIAFAKRTPPGETSPVVYVEIQTGRDGKDSIIRKATAEDFEKWPDAYALFLAEEMDAERAKRSPLEQTAQAIPEAPPPARALPGPGPATTKKKNHKG